jgi:hypothetical protein
MCFYSPSKRVGTLHAFHVASGARAKASNTGFFMSIITSTSIRIALAAALGLVASAASAVTPFPQYPTRGKENPVEYSFKAARTGNITAWYTGTTASYSENLGLMVNGVKTGITGLNNKTSKVGDTLILGNAKAGDKLTFYIDVLTTKKTYFSDKSLNADGVNHIFSASYAGSNTIPAGTYIGFEDLWQGGDFNYFDLSFVFQNVASKEVPAVGGVPEPSSWAMLIAGFGLTGATLRRRRIAVAV